MIDRSLDCSGVVGGPVAHRAEVLHGAERCTVLGGIVPVAARRRAGAAVRRRCRGGRRCRGERQHREARRGELPGSERRGRHRALAMLSRQRSFVRPVLA